jgi:hypothetical protein
MYVARAILKAEAQLKNAAAGNDEGLYIALWATRADGYPLLGINIDGSEFECKRALLSEDREKFRPLTVKGAGYTQVPGLYVLTVKPPTTDAGDLWKRGHYTIFLGLQNGDNRGQTLTGVEIP